MDLYLKLTVYRPSIILIYNFYYLILSQHGDFWIAFRIVYLPASCVLSDADLGLNLSRNSLDIYFIGMASLLNGYAHDECD